MEYLLACITTSFLFYLRPFIRAVPSAIAAYPRTLQVQAPRYGRGHKHRPKGACGQASTVRARCSAARQRLQVGV